MPPFGWVSPWGKPVFQVGKNSGILDFRRVGILTRILTPGFHQAKHLAKTWWKLGCWPGNLGNTWRKPGFCQVEINAKPPATGRNTRFSPGKSQALPQGKAWWNAGAPGGKTAGHQAKARQTPGVCLVESWNPGANVRYRENQEPPRTVAPVEKINF